MTETVKEFMEENCRPTAKNKLICRNGEEVKVIDPLQDNEYTDPATEDNIKEFLDRQEAQDVEQHGSSHNTPDSLNDSTNNRHGGMTAGATS